MSSFVTRAREALHRVGWVLKLLWRSHRGATATLSLLTLLLAVVPVAQLSMSRLLIDQVVAIIKLPPGLRSGPPLTQALLYLALEAATVLTGIALGLANGHARNLLQEHVVY